MLAYIIKRTYKRDLFPFNSSFHKNYFNLLNIKQEYNIDLKKLKANYLSLQKVYHPDKGNFDHQMSTHINVANNTLRDPVQRGVYILSLEGIDLGASKVSPRVVESFFKLSEDVEELHDNPKELKKIKTILSAEILSLKDLIHYTYMDRDLKQMEKLVIELEFKYKILNKIN